MAETTRQQKYSKLIQKELSDIFLRDKRGILDNAFVTIADVRMSPDLSVARIYISMLLVKEKEKVLENITLRKGEIRKALGNRIGKQVRIIPELIFFKDEVFEKNSSGFMNFTENFFTIDSCAMESMISINSKSRSSSPLENSRAFFGDMF